MRHKILLYNPRAVFYTMPLGLIAVGSALDPTKYEVVIIDGRLESDPVAAVLAHLDSARRIIRSAGSGSWWMRCSHTSIAPCASAWAC